MPKQSKPSVFHTNEFKQLHAVWMDKLKASGFKDQERGALGNSIRFDSVREKAPTVYKLRAEADTLRRQFLLDYEFESEADKHLWSVYTDNGGTVPRKAHEGNAMFVYSRMRGLKRQFREWFLTQCQDESVLIDCDSKEILRELEMQDGRRAAEGYAAQTCKFETYDEGARRWKRTHGADGG